MPTNVKFTLEQVHKIFERYGWRFIDEFYNSNSYAHSAICKCGHLTKKRLNDLGRYPGCRKCGNNYIPTLQELKFEFLQKGCEFLDDFYVNSHYKHNYRCTCGRESKIRLNNWRNGKRCKDCGNVLVYDMTLPSNVYLLQRNEQFKIGKNNRKSWRLVTHKNNGWNILDKLGPVSGGAAHEIEKTIKDCLKCKGIPLGQDAGLEKFDGSSECWLAKDFFVTSIEDLWNKL